MSKLHALRFLYVGKHMPEKAELIDLLGEHYYGMIYEHAGPVENGGKHNNNPNLVLIDMKGENADACAQLVGRMRARRSDVQIVVMGDEQHHNLMLAAGASHCMGEADRANLQRVAQQLVNPEESARPGGLQTKQQSVAYVSANMPSQKNLREILGAQFDNSLVTHYATFPDLSPGPDKKRPQMPKLLIMDIYGRDAGDCCMEIEGIKNLSHAPKVIVIGEDEKYHAFKKMGLSGYVTRKELGSMPQLVEDALGARSARR